MSTFRDEQGGGDLSRYIVFGVLALTWCACGGAVSGIESEEVDAGIRRPPQQIAGGVPIWNGAPIEKPEPREDLVVKPPAGVFQPGFHQALRWSHTTGGKVTFRFKLPVARAGQRLRVAFVAGDGPAVLYRATVARAGEGGELGGSPTLLTFGGAQEVTLAARERVVSDPVPFPVDAFEELHVSFAGDGAWASSAIVAFPESLMLWGDYTRSKTMPDAVPRTQLTGVQTIDVEGPAGPSFVAIGDSITEGYVSGSDDHRRAWPFVASRKTGVPVLNGAVSGQGWWGANEYFAQDVGVLEGITHCIVFVGTNDLAAYTSAEMKERLSILFDRVRPKCTLWVGTLLPKESTDGADLDLVNSRRLALNHWLRNEADVDRVLDFAERVRSREDVNAFADGLNEDGIHPSVEGQRVLGEYTASEIEREWR